MQNFTASERILLKCSNKATIITLLLGFIICEYFLSEHLLIPALAVKFVSIIAGLALALKQDPHKRAETRLGKTILTQAKPLNIICCITGLIVFYYGSWLDNLIVIAAGGAIMLVSSQWYLQKAKRAVSK